MRGALMPLALKKGVKMQIINKSQRTYLINDIKIKPAEIVEVSKEDATKLTKAYPNDLVMVEVKSSFETIEDEEEKPKTKRKLK